MSSMPKEKLRSIMDAASALTSLGDEDSQGGDSGCRQPTTKEQATPTTKEDEKKEEKAEESKSTKRYLPDHKKPNAALTFPEKLMSMMRYAETQGEDFCVSWLEDGKSFIIRNCNDFTRNVVPMFFKPTKFSNFTRKLYRWGFRQVNRGIGPDDPIIFGNELFQRDHPEEMAKMKSITAASTRKVEDDVLYRKQEHAAHANGLLGFKRPLEDRVEGEADQRRLIINQLLQQNKAGLGAANQHLGGPAAFYGGLPTNDSLALRGALGQQSLANQSLKPAYDFQGTGNYFGPSNSLLSQFVPRGQTQMGAGGDSSYPSAAATADIVNAAIAALRYA